MNTTTTDHDRRTGAALLRAILAEPADDALRLIYADWLEEFGGGHPHRAHFIRRQIAGDVQAYASVHFADSLFSLTAGDSHGEGGRWRHWSWSRGFIESVRCELAAWLEHGPAVVRAHPVVRVDVADREPYHDAVMGDWLWMSAARWDEPDNPGGRDELPSPLWEVYLERALRIRKRRGRLPAHASREVALEELSAACLEWAGLPEHLRLGRDAACPPPPEPDTIGQP